MNSAPKFSAAYTGRISISLSDARGGQSGLHRFVEREAPGSTRSVYFLNRQLDRLADRGFITREVGAEDRRMFVITPTATGVQIARRVHRHLADLEEAVGRRVTADDMKGFMKVVPAVEDEAHERTRTRKV